jgi:hypothetical protein
MIVVSRNLQLALPDAFGLNADSPIIGWHNLVELSNISADEEADNYPATQLANPATNLLWRGQSAAEQHLTLSIAYPDPIDYLAVARHNFGSAAIPVSVEGNDGSGFTELVQETVLPDDAPALFRWEPASLTALRLRMQPGLAPPEGAVLYAGKLLILQRRLYVGHTPIKYGRKTMVINGRSESGNFLGRIVLGQSLESEASLQNITPSWYREHMDPFVEAARERPFFFAWRPGTYPREVGYAWLIGDPQPVNQRPNGMMQIQLQMSGVV